MSNLVREVVQIPSSNEIPKPGPAVPAADRPAWLPAEFKSPEEMVAAYSKLKPAETPAATPAATGNTPAAPAKTEAAPAEKPAAAPADKPDAASVMARIKETFSQTQALQPQDYADLEKLGYDRNTVDTYLAGVSALQSRVFELAGGKEQYQSLMTFGASLPQAERDAFDAAMQSGNFEQMKLAVAGLKAQFESKHGSVPATNLQGTRPSNGSLVPFRSNAEVIKIMSSREYRTDPAVQAEVAARLAISDI